MPDFLIGVGYNLPIESLSEFVPYSPLTPGLQYTRSTPTASGRVVNDGPFIRFTFGLLSETQFQALLTQCGIFAAVISPVTLYAQDENYMWRLFNGVTNKPLNEGRRGFWLNNVPILITKLRVTT